MVVFYDWKEGDNWIDRIIFHHVCLYSFETMGKKKGWYIYLSFFAMHTLEVKNINLLLKPLLLIPNNCILSGYLCGRRACFLEIQIIQMHELPRYFKNILDVWKKLLELNLENFCSLKSCKICYNNAFWILYFKQYVVKKYNT